LDLNAIVAGAIGAVNPQTFVSVQVSTGYATGSDGKRTPTYAPAVVVPAQVQPLQYGDIVQADGLNVQGVRRKIYINGPVHGLVRAFDKGGDIIVLPDSTTWKIAFIVEAWPRWTSAVITLQDGS
jgi:hypothetical protein